MHCRYAHRTVTAGVHLLGPSGRRFKRSMCTFTPWPAGIYCTYHDLPYKFRTILLLAFDSPNIPNTSIGSIGSVAIFRKIEKLQPLGNGMKFQYQFIAKTRQWVLSHSDPSVEFSRLQYFNTDFKMHLWKILSWNPNQWFFESQNFSFRESFSFSSFQIPSLLVCTVHDVHIPIVSKIRRLSSVQSSARSIVWYVSSYSSTSTAHRRTAFHGVTVVELNKGFV